MLDDIIIESLMFENRLLRENIEFQINMSNNPHIVNEGAVNDVIKSIFTVISTIFTKIGDVFDDMNSFLEDIKKKQDQPPEMDDYKHIDKPIELDGDYGLDTKLFERIADLLELGNELNSVLINSDANRQPMLLIKNEIHKRKIEVDELCEMFYVEFCNKHSLTKVNENINKGNFKEMMKKSIMPESEGGKVKIEQNNLKELFDMNDNNQYDKIQENLKSVNNSYQKTLSVIKSKYSNNNIENTYKESKASIEEFSNKATNIQAVSQLAALLSTVTSTIIKDSRSYYKKLFEDFDNVYRGGKVEDNKNTDNKETDKDKQPADNNEKDNQSENNKNQENPEENKQEDKKERSTINKKLTDFLSLKNK